MLNIYYGRESTDREKFILSHIDRKSRALLIVPDQYTLEAEKRLFEETGAKALMDVEVISMSRLGYRLLEELGGSRRPFIDKYGRHMILSEVASESMDELQVFRGLETKNSFLEMVNNFISEMKQHNCGLRELETISSREDNNIYLKRKLHDLTLLYGRYEERIEGKYTDSEDYIDLFLGKIGESKLIRDNTIWIYGFDSFAPKALSVIGELMTYAKDVNVVLTCSMNRRDRDSNLFDLGRMVMEKLEEAADLRRIVHDRIPVPETFSAFPEGPEYDAARHIEREIYALPSHKYEGPSEGLPIMVEASNPYNEAENAACYVLHLIRDEGLKLGDIRLIVNDQDVRGPILKRTFEEYGLEIFMDQGRPIEDNPIVRYVMDLFDVILEKYSTPAVMAMLKTGLGGLTGDETADLENYAIKYRIKGSMWLKPFYRGITEYGDEGLEALNESRERAIAPCLAFGECFKAGTYREFIEDTYRFLQEEINLPERIGALVDAQMEEGREDLAEETDQVWDALLGIMEQIKEIMGEDKFDGKTMRSLLEVGLSGIKVGMLPPTKDGLVMGTMQRSRTGRVKALIVLGANEGIIPSGRPPQGLFGDEEKKRFQDMGIELMKRDHVVLMEEKMGIYRSLSSAEKLYISYSMSDIEGASQKPSSVWFKLKEIFPDIKVRKDAVSERDMDVLLNGEFSGLRHIANEIERVTEGEKLTDTARRGLDWYKKNDPEKLKSIRRSLGFTNKVDDLGKELAADLYKKDPLRDMSISPSRIEKFSRCPFAHFVSYGLKPDERRVFEVAPREIGDVYHACLMKITELLSSDGLPFSDPGSKWRTVTDDELKEMVETFVKEETGTYNEGLFSAGNEEKYRADRILDACYDVAKTMVDQVRAGRILGGRFEAGFGRGREIPPIEVPLGEEFGGRKAYIEGIIDRVDYLPDDRVKIIDYKTGNEKFVIKEAQKGYRLQLMLYLQAALEGTKKPAGVFYFHITEPMLNMTTKLSEDPETGELMPDEGVLRDNLAKEFRMNGIMVDDPAVIKNIAGDFKAESRIAQIRNGKEGYSASTRGEERLLSDEAFEELKDTVCSVVSENVQRLLRGDAKINPMKTKERSACTFCDYKGICRFDTIFEGNKWNPVE